jgi:hypothetical protein
MHKCTVGYNDLDFFDKIEHCQQLYEVSRNFKWPSKDGERAEFSKNLRASLFNDDLPNEPTFC